MREQLANLNFPSDAVGSTREVSGTIVFGPNGALVPEQSKITVDLRTLQTDQGRRDNFIKQNTLQTDRFPTAEFVPRQVTGLPSPLPTSGEATFQLSGDLTVHGVTRPVTWDVTARFAGQEVTGTATTRTTITGFGMDLPRVAAVLSIDDEARLEVDFRVTREG